MQHALKPNVFIERLRDAVPNAEKVFRHGNCFKLYVLLRSVYPQAQLLYDPIQGHVWTRIDGVLYDIYGALDRRKEGECFNFAEPMEPRTLKIAHRWRYLFPFASSYKRKRVKRRKEYAKPERLPCYRCQRKANTQVKDAEFYKPICNECLDSLNEVLNTFWG